MCIAPLFAYPSTRPTLGLRLAPLSGQVPPSTICKTPTILCHVEAHAADPQISTQQLCFLVLILLTARAPEHYQPHHLFHLELLQHLGVLVHSQAPRHINGRQTILASHRGSRVDLKQSAHQHFRDCLNSEMQSATPSPVLSIDPLPHWLQAQQLRGNCLLLQADCKHQWCHIVWTACPAGICTPYDELLHCFSITPRNQQVQRRPSSRWQLPLGITTGRRALSAR
mmetsp:Transcript_14430/g.25755  ORF Transcript_14430/g.25755 Transcript_14430/m.25755 type:complete len:226 (-) Transcript_14430:1026-1703(-)